MSCSNPGAIGAPVLNGGTIVCLEPFEVDDRSEEQRALDDAAAAAVVDDVVTESKDEVEDVLRAVVGLGGHTEMLQHANKLVRDALMVHPPLDTTHGLTLQAYQYKHDTLPESERVVKELQRINKERGGASWTGPYEADGCERPAHHAKFPVSLEGIKPPNDSNIHRVRVEFRLPPCTQHELVQMATADKSETPSSLRNLPGSFNLVMDPAVLKAHALRTAGFLSTNEPVRHVDALVLGAKVVNARNTSSVPFRVHLEVPNLVPGEGRSYIPLSSTTGLCDPDPDDVSTGQLRTTLEAGHLGGPLADPLYAMDKDAFESPEARRWSKINVDEVKKATRQAHQFDDGRDPDHLYLYPQRSFVPETPGSVFEFVVAACGHQLVQASKEIDAEQTAVNPKWKSCVPTFCKSKASGEQVLIVHVAAWERCLDRLVREHHLAVLGINCDAPMRLALTPVTGRQGWEVARRDAMLATTMKRAEPVSLSLTVEFVLLVHPQEIPRLLTDDDYTRIIKPFRDYFQHWKQRQTLMASSMLARSIEYLEKKGGDTDSDSDADDE